MNVRIRWDEGHKLYYVELQGGITRTWACALATVSKTQAIQKARAFLYPAEPVIVWSNGIWMGPGTETSN